MKYIYYIHVQCPIYDPFSPPVQYYTVVVNDDDIEIVDIDDDNGSCSYSVTIAVSPQDAPYSVSVVATNDVGNSTSGAVLASKLNVFGGKFLTDTMDNLYYNRQ